MTAASQIPARWGGGGREKPQISSNEERRFYEGPECKVSLLLYDAQVTAPRHPHLQHVCDSQGQNKESHLPSDLTPIQCTVSEDSTGAAVRQDAITPTRQTSLTP